MIYNYLLCLLVYCLYISFILIPIVHAKDECLEATMMGQQPTKESKVCFVLHIQTLLG